MQIAVVSVFFSFCLLCVTVESRNVTTISTKIQIKAAGVTPKATKAKKKVKVAATDVARIHYKWENETTRLEATGVAPKATKAKKKDKAVATDAARMHDKWETGWFVAGCYADSKDDRDLPVGPFSISGNDPYPVCAGYCIDKGNRYAGLQLSPDDPSAVLCFCGLTVGRHGISHKCSIQCPGAAADVHVCGNKLVNTVIYVYRVRRSTFQDLYLGTSAIVIVSLLLTNTIVITGCAIYLVLTAKRMLSLR